VSLHFLAWPEPGDSVVVTMQKHRKNTLTPAHLIIDSTSSALLGPVRWIKEDINFVIYGISYLRLLVLFVNTIFSTSVSIL